MDGYSVEEAAEVLGIPQGRVWELIARGVLAGVAEGRSDMRVFLKPAAPPGPDAARSGAASDGGQGGRGGNGGSHLEASPFRELLTEFRNLTERYGQALLALGEARGEVAALRSRVEVLEARMDMRLPLRSASTVAWELPDRYAAEAAGAAALATEPPAQAPDPGQPPAESAAPAEVTLPEPPLPGDEPTADVEPESEAGPEPEPEPEPEPQVEPEPEPPTVAETDVQPGASGTDAYPEVRFVHPAESPAEPLAEPPRRRVSGGRAAVAGLAEALARAEDPTLADLPGAREAAAALAALQQAVDSTPETQEPAAASEEAPPEAPEPEHEAADEVPEPSQAAFAQPMAEVEEEPVAQAAPAGYSTDVVEPDWFADGDFTWLDASDQPAATPEAPAEPEPGPEPGPDAASTSPDAEMDHLEREGEAPAVDALQEAFDHPAVATSEPVVPEHPAPESDAGPPEPESPESLQPEPPEPPDPESQELEPDGMGEVAHVGREDEAAAAEAIQDAFDEPDATHAAGTAAWPAEDRGPITGSGGVGFGLFRSQGDVPRATVAPAAPPTDEEAILWFGDEFEAGDLEVAAPGWRDQERADAASPLDVQPTTDVSSSEASGAQASESGSPASAPDAGDARDAPDAPAAHASDAPDAPAAHASDAPDAPAPSDDEIARLAAQGWDSSEVEAIRSYLGRAPGIAHPPQADPGGSLNPAHDQDWLRGRRGPAASAYRRFRRLFQG